MASSSSQAAPSTVAHSSADIGSAITITLTFPPEGKSLFTLSAVLSSMVFIASSSIGSLGSHLTLVVTQGTGTVSFGSSCTNFTPDGSGAQIYNGTLSNFAATYSNYASGLSLTNASASTTWSNGDSRVYKFQITLPSSDTTGSGLNTGSHSYTWEAQNA